MLDSYNLGNKIYTSKMHHALKFHTTIVHQTMPIIAYKLIQGTFQGAIQFRCYLLT
jgi:hypothetical protein